MRLVLYSLAVWICLLVVNELAFIYYFYPKIIPRAENQWIGNYIKAQSYIYDHADAPLVIVGSSLSNRLRGDLLPSKAFNLSFDGLSAFDGINIVLGTNTRPRTVFVEMNVLDRDPDPGFEERLLSPGLYALRRRMISLRDVARPLTVGLSYLQGGIRRVNTLLVPTTPSSTLLPPDRPASKIPAIFGQLLSSQKQWYQNALTIRVQQRLASDLRNEVDALKQRGISVVFFELPINSELCESPKQTSLRRLLHDQFPDERYLRVTDCSMVQTSDGVHPTDEEAKQVTPQFARMLE
jgi:hypothetical protein